MKKSLTIEELKNRVGKPVFVANLIYGNKSWKVLIGTGFAGVNILAFTDSSEIPEENQDEFRFFDTEVSATELREVLESEEKEKKKTGYERVGESEKYHYIDAYLSATYTNYSSLTNYDSARYKIANHFNDEKLCENIARAEQLKYKLRRYAALNGGIPSQADWKNSHVAKYELIGESDNFIHATKNFESRAVGAIYFKDIEACKKAIEIFKDELIWYFTEFEEQLY